MGNRRILGLLAAFALVWPFLAGAQEESPDLKGGYSPFKSLSPSVAGGNGQRTVSIPAPVTNPTSAPIMAKPGAPEPPPSSAPFGGPAAAPAGSDAFGHWLFSGAFTGDSFRGFNPDYAISVGDTILVRLWGAYELDARLVVDPQGNIFIPRVGPVKVSSVRNDKLNETITARVGQVYQENVGVYASLDASQPVRVYVTGFVKRPGLYSGLSSDAILTYLDKAGGVDPERGSYLDVKIMRGKTVRKSYSLYEFLLGGVLPGLQLGDGDTILVGPRRHTIKVSGLAENPYRFEFGTKVVNSTEVARLARPLPQVTNVRVVRNQGSIRNVDYLDIEEFPGLKLYDGDEVVFTADKRPGTISVRVEGEQSGRQEFVLPYGTTLGSVLAQVSFNERSDQAAVQLFRKSVQTRQKEMLQASLKSLENRVLTARSDTTEEATLRIKEAELMMQWIQRAKDITPRGQILLAHSSEAMGIALEDGDIIRVPRRDALVMVHGEVLFPNAAVFREGDTVIDYVNRSGGFAQGADTTQILLLRRDGSFARVEKGDWRDREATVRPGDEIMVLPDVTKKTMQYGKDLTQILYQIAVSAAVVLTVF
jgi:protein involved in polysaccharide export with SLBB domain